MVAVRSACVARGTVGASGAIAYQVPPGRTFILKSIVVTSPDAAPGEFTVGVVQQGGAIVALVMREQLEQQVPMLWSNWVVLNAGDYINIYPFTTSASYWISGAELQGVLPPAAVTLPAPPPLLEWPPS